MEDKLKLEDFQTLIIAKSKEPGVKMDDLYKNISSFHPKVEKGVEFWFLLILFSILAFICMITMIATESTVLFRICLLTYIISFIVIVATLFHYKSYWWLAIISAFVFPTIMYVNKNDITALCKEILEIVK